MVDADGTSRDGFLLGRAYTCIVTISNIQGAIDVVLIALHFGYHARHDQL